MAKQSILQAQGLSKEDLKAQIIAGVASVQKFRWRKEAKKLLELLHRVRL